MTKQQQKVYDKIYWGIFDELIDDGYDDVEAMICATRTMYEDYYNLWH